MINTWTNKYYNPSSCLANLRPWNICQGNRTAGKSFGWKWVLLDEYFTTGMQFMVLFRNIEDAAAVAPYQFNDVLDLKYPDVHIKTKQIIKGFGEYKIGTKTCGYYLSIKKYNMLKQITAVQKVKWILFDEFIPEDGKFLKGEVDMVRNIYTTTARGGGEMFRSNCHIVLISNYVTLSNPYIKEFPELVESIKPNTKKIVRETVYFEKVTNSNAQDAISSSRFGKSISNTKYGRYAIENESYLDNNAFIEKIHCSKEYYFTFIISGEKFAVYNVTSKGIVYISKAVDESYKLVLNIDTDDHDINFLMVMKNSNLIKAMAKMFRYDAVRFEDLDCKLAFLIFIGLDK